MANAINPLLSALKTDLGIRSTTYDERLTAKITEAQTELTAQGIVLENTVADNELVVMYAAWLWRDRVEGKPMSPMLRMARNNRLFGRKARVSGSDTGGGS